MPLLVMTALLALTLNGMPLATLVAHMGIPTLLVRLPIGVVTAIYYARVSFALVEIIGPLLKKKFYHR